MTAFSIAASVKFWPDDFMLSPFCASATDTPTGLVLFFEVGARPPHDGMRRMGPYNLRDSLAANQRQDRQSYELTPPVVPVRTFSVARIYIFCLTRPMPPVSCTGWVKVASGCGPLLASQSAITSGRLRPKPAGVIGATNQSSPGTVIRRRSGGNTLNKDCPFFGTKASR